MCITLVKQSVLKLFRIWWAFRGGTLTKYETRQHKTSPNSHTAVWQRNREMCLGSTWCSFSFFWKMNSLSLNLEKNTYCVTIEVRNSLKIQFTSRRSVPISQESHETFRNLIPLGTSSYCTYCLYFKYLSSLTVAGHLFTHTSSFANIVSPILSLILKFIAVTVLHILKKRILLRLSKAHFNWWKMRLRIDHYQNKPIRTSDKNTCNKKIVCPPEGL